LSEEFDPEMGKNVTFSTDELIEYVNRIIRRKNAGPKGLKGDNKKKTDYVKFPHLHSSIMKRVVIQTTDGVQVDLNKFREIVTKRPEKLLKQNEKMKKSSTDDTIFFNTSLPALRGLVVDEGTGEFKIVNTCPSAAECLLKCYAKHGSYILFPEVSMSYNRILNFLFNNSKGYEEKLIGEIKQVVKNLGNNKKAQIRWNDSGDLLSKKYFDIVMRIVNATPEAEHYIYTKEVAMIKAFSNPPNNVIFNFSFGGRKEQEKLIDREKDKYSQIVDTENATKEPLLNEIIKNKYIARKDEKWVYNNIGATKKIISTRFNLNVKKLLTVDELIKTPKGKNGEYNVIVLPGESDFPASRRDVRGTFLMIH
jgi:hypothetical protein